MPKSGYMLTWTAGYPDPNLGYPTHLPALERKRSPMFCMHAHQRFWALFRAAGYPRPQWLMNQWGGGGGGFWCIPMEVHSR